MTSPLRSLGSFFIACALLSASRPAGANEIWVAPTVQTDFGGPGIGSNVVWPVTPFGIVRLAWGVPNNLQTFQNARLVLIPHAPAGAGTLNVFVCRAQNSDLAGAACTGPLAHPFTGVANRLLEVDVSAAIGAQVGAAGLNYLAVLAYTTPATTTDHILGLRFAYAPATPAGVATLGANTFSGTQTAPAFAGDGSALTNLPFPSGAATLGANTFTGTQTAPAFVGSGVSLTGVAKLTTNTFTATQIIDTGNLDLDQSTATTGNVTKSGTRFLHNFGVNNAFLGAGAGNLTMTGPQNTGLGSEALVSNTTGSNNAASGYSALFSNTSGASNTASGSSALANNTSGNSNTAAGTSALNFNATGSSNTAAGAFALVNSNGHRNTALGSRTLHSNTTGSDNVALGFEAGMNATASNNIYLGANVLGLAADATTMRLGNTDIVAGPVLTRTFVAGVRGIATLNPNAVPVLIDSAGQLGTTSSSVRFKEDVHDMAGASQRLLQLRPVTFRYKQAYGDGSKPMQFGLVAEEVAEVFPELAVRNANGQVETVHYETLNVLLLNELQEQVRRNDDQQRRIESLEQRMNERQP